MASPTPRSERMVHWAAVALFALVAVRPALALSPLLAAGIACALAAGFAWCAPAGARGTLARPALLLAASLGTWSSAASLGWGAPWRAFFAQEPGQSPLLLLRTGLYLALVLGSENQSTRRRFVVLGTGALLLVASLAFRGLLLPYCAVAAALLGWCARGAPVFLPLPARTMELGALALAALSLFGPPGARPSAEEPRAPRAAIAWWLERKNPYQAHYRAARWAQDETVPAEGYLELARLDIGLGRREAARKVLAKLLARTSSEALREEAKQLAASLEPGEKP